MVIVLFRQLLKTVTHVYHRRQGLEIHPSVESQLQHTNGSDRLIAKCFATDLNVTGLL